MFAPLKRARIDYLVEKATELGVSALLPAMTERTAVERLNLERLRAHAREAAEQTERLTLPEIRQPAALADILARWPAERRLLAVCRVRRGARHRRAIGARAARAVGGADRPGRRLFGQGA